MQDIIEFKTSYHFFLAPTTAIFKKKLVGFYSNSLHCKFEFFTKHLTSQEFIFFNLCCISANIKGLVMSVVIINFIVFDIQSTGVDLAPSPLNKIYQKINVLQSNVLSYFTFVIGGKLSLSHQ